MRTLGTFEANGEAFRLVETFKVGLSSGYSLLTSKDEVILRIQRNRDIMTPTAKDDFNGIKLYPKLVDLMTIFRELFPFEVSYDRCGRKYLEHRTHLTKKDDVFKYIVIPFISALTQP